MRIFPSLGVRVLKRWGWGWETQRQQLRLSGMLIRTQRPEQISAVELNT